MCYSFYVTFLFLFGFYSCGSKKNSASYDESDQTISNKLTNFYEGVIAPLFSSEKKHRQDKRLLDIPLETVNFVDINKYSGVWYEQYRYSNSFEDDNCTDVKAVYALNEEGIKVTNSCFVNSKKKIANGIAKVVDSKTNSKLKVSFFWPFYGSYWIVDLDENYNWAIVSSDNADYLWVLTRDKFISDDHRNFLLDRVTKLGFNKNLLIKTLHTAIER